VLCCGGRGLVARLRVVGMVLVANVPYSLQRTDRL
jgi:hypothetical protein